MWLVWLIYGGVFVAMGCVAGGIWDTKGGGWGRGFAYGFLLGPIGLVYVAFAWPGKPCRWCEQRNSERARHCRACTRELRWPVEVPDSDQS